MQVPIVPVQAQNQGATLSSPSSSHKPRTRLNRNLNHMRSHASDLDTPVGGETSLESVAAIPVSDCTHLGDALDGSNTIDAK